MIRIEPLKKVNNAIFMPLTNHLRLSGGWSSPLKMGSGRLRSGFLRSAA